MKFTIYMTNIKSRFTMTKSIAAQPTQEADIVPKSKRLSPQELEDKFLQEMADAYNQLKLTKQIEVHLTVNNLQVVRDTSGTSASQPNIPANIHTLLTGTTACTPALGGATLLDEATQARHKCGPDALIAADPTIPDHRSLRVDDFEPIKFLGRGGFGSVYLVRDRTTHRFYALKVIDKERLPLSFYPKVFEEQRVGKSLVDCKWAMGIEGSFDEYEYFYILMKYASGGDLLQRIRNFGVPKSKVLRDVFAELVVAVENLHQRRIIHRDIKLENILIDDEGHILLADFGLSKAFVAEKSERPWEDTPAWCVYPAEEKLDDVAPQDRGRDLSAETAGTPGYQAPEQLYGNRQHSYEVDIWSLGAVLHVFITGGLPFGVDNTMPAQEINRRVLDLPLTFPSWVDPKPRDLIARMLEKDPSRRITIPEIKAHPYFRDIDWDAVARREANPMQQAQLYRGTAPHLVQKEPGLHIPAADPYDDGDTPFPWFHYAPAELSKPADPIIEQPAIPPSLLHHRHTASDTNPVTNASDVSSSSRSCKSASRSHSSSQQKSEKRGIRAVIKQLLKIRLGIMVEVKPKPAGARMLID